jgi:imidazolonepropionase-like amidohydrolase
MSQSSWTATLTFALFAGGLGAQQAARSLPPPSPEFKVYYGRRPAQETDYKVARWGPRGLPSPALALRAARAIPVEGPPIEDAVLLCRNGKIEALGRAGEVTIPSGYETIELGDYWLVPGFVDLHCHSASPSSDINDMVHQTNPEFRTMDLITLDHERSKLALAGGVTTVLYIPGSGTNMGGFGTLTKLHGDPREALVRFPGCLKIAQAGNPERRSGDLGTTPLGMNQGLRFTLERGRDYCKAWEAFEAGKGPKPEFKPDLEYLRGLFLNEYPVAVHTQIYQVMLATLTELRGEFGLWTIVVHGCFDAYRLSGKALELGVPICSGPRSYHFDRATSVIMPQAPGFYWGGIYGFQAPSAGVGRNGIAVNTDSPVVAQEELQLQCSMAVRLGMPDDVGLRALTINPARFVGVDHRLGSLEVGKDADVVAWSGDPIDPRSHVQMTVVNGRIAYRRDPKRPRF